MEEVERGLKDVDFRKSKTWAKDPSDGSVTYRKTAIHEKIITGGVKRLKLEFHSEKARGAPPYSPRAAVASPHPRSRSARTRRALPPLFVFSSFHTLAALRTASACQRATRGATESAISARSRRDLGAISAASSSVSTYPHDAIHRYYIGLGCSQLVGAEPECMKTGTLWATEMAKTYLRKTIVSGKDTTGGSVVVVPCCCAVLSNEVITERVVILRTQFEPFNHGLTSEPQVADAHILHHLRRYRRRGKRGVAPDGRLCRRGAHGL